MTAGGQDMPGLSFTMVISEDVALPPAAGGQDMPSDLIDLVRSQRGGTTMAEDLLIERIEELEAALKEIVHGSSDGMTHGGIKCREIAKAALKEQT